MQDVLKELQEIKLLLKLNQPMLTLEAFCLFADISLDQCYKLTSNKQIKFYRPGGKKIYIDREDAIAYLKQNAVESLKKLESVAINHSFTSKIAA